MDWTGCIYYLGMCVCVCAAIKKMLWIWERASGGEWEELEKGKEKEGMM